jgi:hypothetical protein
VGHARDNPTKIELQKLKPNKKCYIDGQSCGSGNGRDGKKSGSGMNIPDHNSESEETIL